MSERLQTLQIGNAITLGSDGWAMLAPFGDHPGVAFTTEGRRDVVQRVDAEAGAALRRSLLSLPGKAARFFRSVPIFNGHPDVQPIAERFPDSEIKGHVGDLQVRDDGIYILPILNESGAALINGGERLGLSAYVDAAVLGEEDGRTVVHWARLKSVGMTPFPNLPVELLNSRIEGASGESHPPNPTMNQTMIIAALAAAGIQIANAASEADVLAGIRALHERHQNALSAANAKDTELAGLRTERDALQVELANERDARRKEVLDLAVANGSIPEADRSLWDGRLKANFPAESAALRALPSKLKTGSTIANAGSRRGTDADPASPEAYIANVRQAIKEGGKPADAHRTAMVALPNSYAAWREAGCPAV